MAYPVDKHAVVLALDRIKMRGDETWYDYYHKALDAVAKLPPVDAAPVRHGRWVKRPKNALGYDCTACGKSAVSNNFDYCPNCGADMRGEQHEVI